MKLSIDCDISLSKKLRSLLGEDGYITLHTDSVSGGKGKAKLVLVSNKGVDYQELPEDLKRETSIMLTPTDLSVEAAPTGADPQYATIFQTTPVEQQPVQPQQPQVQPQQIMQPPQPQYAPPQQPVQQPVQQPQQPIPPQYAQPQGQIFVQADGTQVVMQPSNVHDMSGGQSPYVEARSPADRLAATMAPAQGNLGGAILRPNEVPAPNQFPELQQKSYQEYIRDYDQLMEEVNVAKNKVSNIDPSQIADPRLRAIEQERKEHLEAIEKKALIVTEVSAISVNDMDISLSGNTPYDLSNISAKRIAASSDLKALIDQGLVKFIGPEEVEGYVKKSLNIKEAPSIPVYDNIEQAAAGIQNQFHSTASIDGSRIEEINMDGYGQAPTGPIAPTGPTAPIGTVNPSGRTSDRTDDEIMLQNLTQGML
jgi:hypothetical protein